MKSSYDLWGFADQCLHFILRKTCRNVCVVVVCMTYFIEISYALYIDSHYVQIFHFVFAMKILRVQKLIVIPVVVIHYDAIYHD